MFPDGGKYTGEWSRGKMHGLGKFTFQKTWVYGTWENGELTEVIRQKIPKKPKPTKPAPLNPLRCTHGDCDEGYGVFRYTDGQYEGYWKNGQKSGSGDFFWDEAGFYSGEWQQDMKNGRGFREYKSGDKFSGFWENGLRHGEGVLWKNDGTIITGEWKTGELINSSATYSKLGEGVEISNRDLLNYIFYSNQSINKNLSRFKNNLIERELLEKQVRTMPGASDEEESDGSKKPELSTQSVLACADAKEEVMRIISALEGRQRLEKSIPAGESSFKINPTDALEEQSANEYFVDKYYTYQDLQEARSSAETACKNLVN